MSNWDPLIDAGGMGGAGGDGAPWGGLFPDGWGDDINRTFGNLTDQVSNGTEHAVKHIAHDVHDVAHELSGVSHPGSLPVVAVPVHGGGTAAGGHPVTTHVVGGAAVSHATGGLTAAHVGAAHALAVTTGPIGIAVVAALGGLAALSRLSAEEKGQPQSESEAIAGQIASQADFEMYKMMRGSF